MLSLGRLSPGHAAYFQAEVASGREDYYAGRGESPGVWNGAGARAAGLEGQVLDGQLTTLFGLCHPVTGEPLGASYVVAGSYVDRFGVTQTRVKRSAFDATFSLPKSVSEIYAHSDRVVQGEILAGAQVAVDAAIGYLEANAAFSRQGKGGVRQVDTEGLVVAQFMHRTSRAGDPQVHFHLLISNRVRCGDGKWRALDGRNLHAELKTAGMVGQAVLRAELDRRVGVQWGPVSEHGQAEIVGVPAGLLRLHSQRTRQVEGHARRAITNAESVLGRALTAAERAEKYNQAAVQTRAVKSRDLQPLEGLEQRWRTEATEAGFDPARWLPDTLARSLSQRQAGHPGRDEDQVVAEVLAVLTREQSTWGRTEVIRQVSRLVPHWDHPGDVPQHIEQLTRRVLASGEVVQLTYPLPVGDGQVRSDGMSELEVHHSTRYATLTTLGWEQAVLDHVETGRNAGIAMVDPAQVTAGLAARAAAGRALSADQTAAVSRVLCSGEAVVAVVGPAGAGKSATIGTAAAIYDQAGVLVRGLAVSAVAAGVLREEAGITRSDTLAKLLYEYTRPEGPAAEFQLSRGEVLVVDEASMVSSAQFVALVQLARSYEAKIVAVGDYRQLGAVQAGGLFSLIAREEGAAVELDQVWRFHQRWERDASLRLRHADVDVIDLYHHHHRVHGGTRDQVLDRAFNGWATARRQGRSVIVTATDRNTVAEFNNLARRHLQQNGQLPAGGPLTEGGIELAPGDEILTLRNDRRLLTTSGGHVRNGDRWQITHLNNDGGLLVHGLGGQGHAALPASYLTEGLVDHAYATTVHKAQGVTVDAAITIIDPTTTAESLYVGATRGRHDNQLLAVCEPDPGEYAPVGQTPTPVEVIASAMRRNTLERTATEYLRQQLDQPDAARGLGLTRRNQTRQEHTPAQGLSPQPVPVGPVRAERPGRKELDGVQLRALWTEQAAINTALSAAQKRQFSNDLARRADRAKLAELGHQRDGHTDRISYLDSRLDLIVGRNPIARFRARDSIRHLQTERARLVEQLAELDGNIHQAEQQVQLREHGLGGRTNHDRALQQARSRADTRTPEISQAFEQDLQQRSERIAGMAPAEHERYGLGPLPNNGPERDRWLDRAARLDQHHTAWNGTRTIEQPTAEHEIDLERIVAETLQRRFNPPQPARDRGIDDDYGISL